MQATKLAGLIRHYRRHNEQQTHQDPIELYQNGNRIPVAIFSDAVWVEFSGSAQAFDGEELEQLADNIEGLEVSQYDEDPAIPMVMLRYTVSQDNESPANDIVGYVLRVLEECFNLSADTITNAVETNCPDLEDPRSWDEVEQSGLS